RRRRADQGRHHSQPPHPRAVHGLADRGAWLLHRLEASVDARRLERGEAQGAHRPHDHRYGQPAMIEVDRIGKSFGKIEALADVSATFADGEVVAIIGPSGGGKSTLIRCINGLERLDGGNILVDGKSVRDRAQLTAIRSACAMVFQQFNLYPHMTALANITL